MTYYSCTSHSTHAPTDQSNFVGCRECVIDQYSQSTQFLTEKHIHIEGDEIKPFVSCFTFDHSNHTLTIESTGEAIVLKSLSDFVGHWLKPERGNLHWNQKYGNANWLAHDVGYKTGSWSTAAGSTAFTSDLTGIQVAKFLEPDAHGFPVNPGDPHITQDLVAWPFTCACGNRAPENQTRCLVCQMSSGSTGV